MSRQGASCSLAALQRRRGCPCASCCRSHSPGQWAVFHLIRHHYSTDGLSSRSPWSRPLLASSTRTRLFWLPSAFWFCAWHAERPRPCHSFGRSHKVTAQYPWDLGFSAVSRPLVVTSTRHWGHELGVGHGPWLTGGAQSGSHARERPRQTPRQVRKADQMWPTGAAPGWLGAACTDCDPSSRPEPAIVALGLGPLALSPGQADLVGGWSRATGTSYSERSVGMRSVINWFCCTSVQPAGTLTRPFELSPARCSCDTRRICKVGSRGACPANWPQYPTPS